MSTRDYKTPNEILVTLKGDARADVETRRVRRGSVQLAKIPIRFLPRRTPHDEPPPPPPGGGPGAGSMPTPIVVNFPPEHGLVPSPGSGVPTIIYRRVELNIHAGTTATAGWLLGPLREIKSSRNGLVYVDTTRDFSFSGWGSGSASNTFVWTVNRIFLPIHDLGSNSFQGYFTGGTQLFEVRDQYHNGATVAWSPWGSVIITWPPDEPLHPGDAGEVAYLNSARVDDS
jgi:hypothetical protein